MVGLGPFLAIVFAFRLCGLGLYLTVKLSKLASLLSILYIGGVSHLSITVSGFAVLCIRLLISVSLSLKMVSLS